MNNDKLINALYESIGEVCATAPDIAHVEIHGNQVLGLHLVPGLEIENEELEDGIRAEMIVRKNHKIDQPVRICFGLLDETGKQNIQMKVRLEEGAQIAVLASCTFPNALDVLHSMDADIEIGKDAEYIYLERHVHSDEGGVRIVPRSKIRLLEGARFQTDFELIQGQVGSINLEYMAECEARSVLDMSARISARDNDTVEIHEAAHLIGEGAHSVLRTNIAVTDNARADIKNTVVASAPYTRGHVDCKEVVRKNGIANAIPIVEVQDPKAHVTHEASIGSVDNKQLETLMARGLSEDDAVELIISGMLSR